MTDEVRQLGRYAIHDSIASGGMARVHLARQLGSAGFARPVAMKILHPNLASDPRFVAMLIDEAHLAARIRHPNVVPILDIVTADREIALVMEFVHGESLDKLIAAARKAGEPIEAGVISTVMVGALEGLHAAHEAKAESGASLSIIHRDVSPHNVLVGVDGVTRVTDFGVAKAASRLQSTETGELKGKFAYMAPEQLEAKALTRAVDVWAAGLLLWELVARHRLFVEESVDLIRAIRSKSIVVPSSSGGTDLFDAIAMRALSRDPRQRFATAREMAEAIDRQCLPASAREVGAWVERLAAGGLAARSQILARIEREASALKGTGGAYASELAALGVDVAPGPPPERSPSPSTLDFPADAPLPTRPVLGRQAPPAAVTRRSGGRPAPDDAPGDAGSATVAATPNVLGAKRAPPSDGMTMLSAGHEPTSSPPSTAAPVAVRIVPPPTAAAVQPTPAAVETPTVTTVASTRRRRRILVAIAAIALSLVVPTAFVLRARRLADLRRAAREETPTPIASVVAAASSAATSSAAVAITPAPVASSAAVASAALAPRAGGAKGPRPRERPSGPRPAPSAAGPPPDHCNPPYSVGPPPDFIRHPKPECFER